MAVRRLSESANDELCITKLGLFQPRIPNTLQQVLDYVIDQTVQQRNLV